MRLLAARLMVKVFKEEMTSGGIVMPDTAQQNLRVATGKVFKIGDGEVNPRATLRDYYDNIRLPMRVKEGDIVMFFADSAFPCRYEDVDYMLVAEDVVIMILDEKKKE